MNYQLSAALQQRVFDRLSAGNYRSEEDVLRDAMDALDRIEEDKLTRWHQRNQLSQQQSDQGLAKPLDDEAVLARLRARLAQEGILD